MATNKTPHATTPDLATSLDDLADARAKLVGDARTVAYRCAERIRSLHAIACLFLTDAAVDVLIENWASIGPADELAMVALHQYSPTGAARRKLARKGVDSKRTRKR